MAEEAKQGDFGIAVEEQVETQPLNQHKPSKKKKSPPRVQTSLRITTEGDIHTFDVVKERKVLAAEFKVADQLPSDQRTAYIKEHMVYPRLGRNLRVPKTPDNLYNDENSTLENFEIEIDGFLHTADGTTVKQAFLGGDAVGMSAHNLHLENVFVISKDAFAGSPDSSEIPDLRGMDNKRTLDCEYLFAVNSVFDARNFGRNLKGGRLERVYIRGAGALKDAWGGLELIDCVIEGQNNNQPITKRFPLGRPDLKRKDNSSVINRFIGGNTFVPKKPVR